MAMTSPTVLIRKALEYDGQVFVSIMQTCTCRLCPNCKRAIWPIHYYPRGLNAWDIEADFGVTYGHDDNLFCDKCQAEWERQHPAALDDGLPDDRWQASKDPSIAHETDYPDKDIHAQNPN